MMTQELCYRAVVTDVCASESATRSCTPSFLISTVAVVVVVAADSTTPGLHSEQGPGIRLVERTLAQFLCQISLSLSLYALIHAFYKSAHPTCPEK